MMTAPGARPSRPWRAQTDAQGKFELKASVGRDDLIRFNGIESKIW